MKILSSSLILLMFLSGAAHAATTKKSQLTVDCSKIADQSITLQGGNLDLGDSDKPGDGAAERKKLARAFYLCLTASKESVQSKTLASNKELNIGGMCGGDYMKPVISEITYSYSGRVSIYGEAGGNSEFQVRHPLYQSFCGTGLFSGIVNNVETTIAVEQSRIICLEDTVSNGDGEQVACVDKNEISLKATSTKVLE